MQTTGELVSEFRAAQLRGRRQRADHDLRLRRQVCHELPDEMPQSSPDPVANHRSPDRPADDEADQRTGARGGLDTRLGTALPSVMATQMHDQGSTAGPPPRPHGAAEGGAVAQPVVGGEHWTEVRARSDREALAALAATRGDDGAAGAGAHPQSEPVHLVATTVVRLVRALAHGASLPVWGRSGQVWVARVGYRRAAPDDCRDGAARLHSTAADRSTVRGGTTQGQTHAHAGNRCRESLISASIPVGASAAFRTTWRATLRPAFRRAHRLAGNPPTACGERVVPHPERG